MSHDEVKMYCIHCGRELSVGDYPLGCPDCLKKKYPSSLSFKYNKDWSVNEKQRGMKRYVSRLPYGDFISLGEGNTPVITLDNLAKEICIKKLYVKNEFQNPTGSHKDRMNPLIISRAKENRCKMVAAASSGNEGISLACYAAASSIPCTIVANKTISDFWKTAITSLGAKLILTESAHERWNIIKEKTDSEKWFSATNVYDPPVGSCAFGVQGYKTISYEIYEELGDKLPDYILIPVTRGDLLWGIYEGFSDLKMAQRIKKIPRLVAVEPFERIEKIKSYDDIKLHYEGDSRMTPSIGGNTVTLQSLLALKKSRGFAISIHQNFVKSAICEIGKGGLYLESASALPIIALKKLVEEGKISQKETVMIIATSHGFKNFFV